MAKRIVVLERIDDGQYVVHVGRTDGQRRNVRDSPALGMLRRVNNPNGWGVASWTFTSLDSTRTWTEAGIAHARDRIAREHFRERAA